MIISTKD